jgi:hypothetical protein
MIPEAPIDIVVGVTPFLASWCWKRPDALATKGVDVNYRDRKGKTALHYGVDRSTPRVRWNFTRVDQSE